MNDRPMDSNGFTLSAGSLLSERFDDLPWDHHGPIWAMVRQPWSVESLHRLQEVARRRNRHDLVVLGPWPNDSVPTSGHRLPLDEMVAVDPQAVLDMVYKAGMADRSSGSSQSAVWTSRARSLLPVAMQVHRRARPTSWADWMAAMSADVLFGDTPDALSIQAQVTTNPVLHGYLCGLPGSNAVLNADGDPVLMLEKHEELLMVLRRPLALLQGSKGLPVMPWRRSIDERRMVVTFCPLDGSTPPDTDAAFRAQDEHVVSHLVWRHAAWSLRHDRNLRQQAARSSLVLIDLGDGSPHEGWSALLNAWEGVALSRLADAAVQPTDATMALKRVARRL